MGRIRCLGVLGTSGALALAACTNTRNNALEVNTTVGHSHAPVTDGGRVATGPPEPNDSTPGDAAARTGAEGAPTSSSASSPAAPDNAGPTERPSNASSPEPNTNRGGRDGAQADESVAPVAPTPPDLGPGAPAPSEPPSTPVCDPAAAYGSPLDEMGELLDIEFEAMGAPEVAEVGLQPVDGPVWLADRGLLVFSRIDRPGEIWQLDPNTAVPGPFLQSGGGKGMTLDGAQRLVIANEAEQRIVRIDPNDANGAIELLADASAAGFIPNDVIVRDDGNVYITDFNSGLYHLSPTGTLSPAKVDIPTANGVALSLDQDSLYVSATGARSVTRIALNADGGIELGSGEVVITTREDNANGMTLDCAGNFYVTTNGGVEVFTPEGQLITNIGIPDRSVNVAFGGSDRRTLFIASASGFHSMRLGVPGFPN